MGRLRFSKGTPKATLRRPFFLFIKVTLTNISKGLLNVTFAGPIPNTVEVLKALFCTVYIFLSRSQLQMSKYIKIAMSALMMPLNVYRLCDSAISLQSYSTNIMPKCLNGHDIKASSYSLIVIERFNLPEKAGHQLCRTRLKVVGYPKVLPTFTPQLPATYKHNWVRD